MCDKVVSSQVVPSATVKATPGLLITRRYGPLRYTGQSRSHLKPGELCLGKSGGFCSLLSALYYLLSALCSPLSDFVACYLLFTLLRVCSGQNTDL